MIASTRSTSCSGAPSWRAISVERRVEVAGLLDLLDDPVGDDQVGARKHLAGLAAEMLVQRELLAGEAVEIDALVRAAAPGAVEAEAAVRAGHRVGGAVLVEILALRVDVERRIAAAGVDLGQRVGRLGRRRLGFRLPLAARLGLRRAAAFEQRVLLDLLGDEAFDLEIAQRQQADRLLQLRRHHQRLGLPEVEARPQCHDYSSKLSPR
jgi:hypothetical protein